MGRDSVHYGILFGFGVEGVVELPVFRLEGFSSDDIKRTLFSLVECLAYIYADYALNGDDNSANEENRYHEAGPTLYYRAMKVGGDHKVDTIDE